MCFHNFIMDGRFQDFGASIIDKTGILAYHNNIICIDEDEYLGLSLKESRDGEKPAE